MNKVVKPFTSFWSRDVSIWALAILIKPYGSLITGTITLSTGFHPYQGINSTIIGLGSWPDTKTGVFNVAPVTSLEANVLGTRSSLVDDEVGWETLSLEEGSKSLDVFKLRPIWVVWASTIDDIWGGSIIGWGKLKLSATAQLAIEIGNLMELMTYHCSWIR